MRNRVSSGSPPSGNPEVRTLQLWESSMIFRIGSVNGGIRIELASFAKYTLVANR